MLVKPKEWTYDNEKGQILDFGDYLTEEIKRRSCNDIILNSSYKSIEESKIAEMQVNCINLVFK